MFVFIIRFNRFSSVVSVCICSLLHVMCE